MNWKTGVYIAKRVCICLYGGYTGSSTNSLPSAAHGWHAVTSVLAFVQMGSSGRG